MTTRRRLLARLPLVAAGGAALWLLRDRLPWPPTTVTFADGRSSGWIPLLGREGLIEMPATVAGRPVQVVVDSGAEFSAIDTALAERLRLPRSTLPLVAYGVSGKPSLAYTVRLELDLPGLAVRGVRAAALDIAQLSRITGRNFAMLVGRDVLKSLVLEADLPRGRAAFHAPAAYRPVRDATAIPLRLSGGAPMVTVKVEGVPVEVMVDTGATGVLALSAEAARQVGLLAPGRPSSAAHSVSLGGQSLDRLVNARNIEIADVTLRDTAIQIYAPAAPSPIPSGLLGLGFLRRFRAALDLPGRRLVLVRPGPIVVSNPSRN